MNTTVPEPVPSREGGDHGADFVQSLARGLAVIRAFDRDRPHRTLSDVARDTGLSRAAARRFLHTLVELEYVGFDGKVFWLRPRVLELGHAYVASLGLTAIVQPHLDRLSEVTGESCSVAVLDGDDVVYVARVAVSRIMSFAIGTGTRFPALPTSLGRAIVGGGSVARQEQILARATVPAFTPLTVTDTDALRRILGDVREAGWALVDQELEVGLRSLAVPLRDASGEVVAGVNVSAAARRGDAAEIVTHLLPPLQDAARAMEADIIRADIRVR